jgi:hypothetical protein
MPQPTLQLCSGPTKKLGKQIIEQFHRIVLCPSQPFGTAPASVKISSFAKAASFAEVALALPKPSAKRRSATKAESADKPDGQAGQASAATEYPQSAKIL